MAQNEAIKLRCFILQFDFQLRISYISHSLTWFGETISRSSQTNFYKCVNSLYAKQREKFFLDNDIVTNELPCHNSFIQLISKMLFQHNFLDVHVVFHIDDFNEVDTTHKLVNIYSQLI